MDWNRKNSKKIHDPLLNFVEKKYKLLFKVVNNIIPFKQDTYNIILLNNILNILININLRLIIL